MNTSKSNDQFVFGFFLGLCIVAAGIFVCAASTTDLEDNYQEEDADTETTDSIIMNRLQRNLDKAIANEDFEDAAILRDRIAFRTKKTSK